MKIFQNSSLSRIELCIAAAAGFGLNEDEALDIAESQVGTIANQFSDLCTAIKMTITNQRLLWRKGILNPDIFAGRFDFLNPEKD